MARNDRDWHTLLGFCSVVGSLLIDADGVYDPKEINDRLLLGIKGTISSKSSSAQSLRACAISRCANSAWIRQSLRSLASAMVERLIGERMPIWYIG